LLGIIWPVPYFRVFQLAAYLFEAFMLGIVVKDTPSAHPDALAGL